MFCTNCGSQVADGSAFCTECGAAVQPEPAPAQEAADVSPQTPAEPEPPAKAKAKRKRRPKKEAETPDLSEEEPKDASTENVEEPEDPSAKDKDDSEEPGEPKKPQDASKEPGESEEPEDNSSSPSGDKRKKNLAIGGGIVAAIAILAIALAAIIPGIATTAVKGSVNDYTWDELSKIAGEISEAGSEDAAIDITKKYNLTTADGRLDGTQVKDIELADGTKCQVQIAGLLHDEKTDGSGKAGITFIFSNAIAERPFNATKTHEGGWADSQMRSWLAVEGLNRLPEDLRNAVVEVKKLTNNEGTTKSTSAVTETFDKLWLYSTVELTGAVPANEWPYGDNWVAGIYNAEGEQYKLFHDTNATPFVGNSILAKSFNGSSCIWWERTAVPNVSDEFRCVNAAGHSTDRKKANDSYAVVAGFCL